MKMRLAITVLIIVGIFCGAMATASTFPENQQQFAALILGLLSGVLAFQVFRIRHLRF